jgi:hypothetical protein
VCGGGLCHKTVEKEPANKKKTTATTIEIDEQSVL